MDDSLLKLCRGDRSSTVTKVLPNAAVTQSFGVSLGRSLPVGTNVLLYGDLGSGKTTLVQGLGKGLGILDSIVSPTFTLINEYLEGRMPLYHFDLYRLTEEAAAHLTPEIYWEGVDYEPGIVVIEWAERLTISPPRCLSIEFAFESSIEDAGGRTLHISANHDEALLAITASFSALA